MSKLLDTAEKYISLIIVLLVPLAFLPVFSSSPYELPKILVVVGGVLLIVLIKSLKVLFTGSLKMSFGSFDFPVLLLGVAYVLSGILRTQNKVEAFFLPGAATYMAAVALYYLLIDKSQAGKKLMSVWLLLAATLSSIVSLLAASGVFTKVAALPMYVKDSIFNLMGGQLPLVLFLGTVIPVAIYLILSEKDFMKKVFLATCLAVVLLAFGVSFYKVLPGKEAAPSLPGLTTSWSVSVETLKDNPLLGIGASNYLTAFNRYRPVSYNSSNTWAVRFATSQSFVLTTLGEAGLLGFAALALVILVVAKRVISLVKSVREMKYSEEVAYTLSLTISVVLLTVLPASLPLLVLFAVLLAMNSKEREVIFNLSLPAQGFVGKIPSFLVAIPLLVGIGAASFFIGRAVYAESIFGNALVAISKNDAKGAYDQLRAAIGVNPYADRYHSTYSQINLNIAKAVASKQTLTDEEKTTVAQLIQQAIREAKATVTLNSLRAGNWEVLAKTYQSVIALAQGADQFAIQSYSQAIALDPVNPNLRISLGGVYFALGNYDNAIKNFEMAVISKPDLANAHYNLAVAYNQKGRIDEAIAQMEAVLKLVKKDSEDYKVATKELDALKAKKPAAKAGEGESLSAPKAVEKTNVKPIELPADTTPPQQ